MLSVRLGPHCVLTEHVPLLLAFAYVGGGKEKRGRENGGKGREEEGESGMARLEERGEGLKGGVREDEESGIEG